VHRLEVGQLGLVAGLDERLERHLHERRGAAAQDGLLAEQVGLGLLGECVSRMPARVEPIARP
jgi:hypothetical protein